MIIRYSPEKLKKTIDKAVEEYNNRPHEGLKNVSPNDVYVGRKEAVLKAWQEKKILTMARRKMYNLGVKV